MGEGVQTKDGNFIFLNPSLNGQNSFFLENRTAALLVSDTGGSFIQESLEKMLINHNQFQ